MSMGLLLPKSHFKKRIPSLAIYLVSRRTNLGRRWVMAVEDVRNLGPRTFTYMQTRSQYSLAMNKKLRITTATIYTSLSNRTKRNLIYLWKQLSLWLTFMRLTWFKTISCLIRADRIRRTGRVTFGKQPSSGQASWPLSLWIVPPRMPISMEEVWTPTTIVALMSPAVISWWLLNSTLDSPITSILLIKKAKTCFPRQPTGKTMYLMTWIDKKPQINSLNALSKQVGGIFLQSTGLTL